MTKQLTRSAVRIYGALNALGRGDGSVMEGLLPFFEPILRQYNGSNLDPNIISTSIRDTYKWNFNSDLVEAFVPYLERQGWIVADFPGKKDTSYTIRISENSLSNGENQNIENELRDIAIKFKSFSESLSPLTTIPRDVEEFEDILVEWLIYVEYFGEKSIDFKSSYKEDQSGKLRKIVDFPNLTSLRDEEKFLCARFVKHTIQSDQVNADIISRIAAIGLLTEVVQDFVKPLNVVEKTDLVVYLDAPVALEFLNVSGRLAYENTTPVINELMRIGASVRIFGQSIEEIKNALKAVLNNPRPTGQTAQAIMRREVMREYVVDVSRNPAQFLESLGVTVAYRTREQNPAEHKFFTDENWQDLYSKLSYADNPNAREHDVDITSFVIRQRMGRVNRDIFKSNAIVLTKNGILSQVVRRFYSKNLSMSEDVVPPVIHRRVLATAMWLRTGLGADKLNIPKRLLLASCEQVLAIRPGVVEAVKRFTDALADENMARQLDLLISQDRSAQALMDKTLGQTNVVTSDNLPLLLKEMLQPELEEERQRSEEAVKKAKEDNKKNLEEINSTMEGFKRSAAEKDLLLKNKMNEDRDAVFALCQEVRGKLILGRKIRIIIAIILSVLSCIPLAFETTFFIRILSFVMGFLLAFATITGGSFVRISVDESKALKVLRSRAEKLKLIKKVENFNIKWNGKDFVVLDLPVPLSGDKPRVDLFGGEGNRI